MLKKVPQCGHLSLEYHVKELQLLLSILRINLKIDPQNECAVPKKIPEIVKFRGKSHTVNFFFPLSYSLLSVIYIIMNFY